MTAFIGSLELASPSPLHGEHGRELINADREPDHNRMGGKPMLLTDLTRQAGIPDHRALAQGKRDKGGAERPPPEPTITKSYPRSI